MPKRTDRLMHGGKSRPEREEYERYVRSRSNLEKTEEEAPDIAKTDVSSNEVDEKNIPEITPKSLRLRVYDFLRSGLGITIIGGIILALILGAFSFYKDTSVSIGVSNERISNIEKSISSLNSDTRDNREKINEAKSAFEVFRAEIQKEIQFIKSLLSKGE